ncbi:MAG TPA: GNAT family N-acetyltransferase [Parafilimonas sp.]|nr:GNAT family N-acetyltransferase [Parafilimonas sp.]
MEFDYNISDKNIAAILIRRLEQKDLVQADHIMRLAFGTYLGSPEPANFFGETDYICTRFKANPKYAFCAEVNNNIAGSVFVSNWGGVGFLGPLTVHPALWDKGVAKKLMEPAVDCFDEWKTRIAGLFTFSASAKHVALYQKFGFWPQYLTAIMSKTVKENTGTKDYLTFSELSKSGKENMLERCTELTDAVYDGLDVTSEITFVEEQHLGETILIENKSRLAAFAICHFGPHTEASTGSLYIKFGVADADKGKNNFEKLLSACEAFASTKKLSKIVAGVNTARRRAYVQMLEHDFKTGTQGIIMQRPNKKGYNKKNNFIIDDWR